MSKQPFPFQKEGVKAIEAFGLRCLLADEMGLGKTPQALWTLKRNPKAFPAVVVCPASVKYNWAKESTDILGIEPLILSGKKPPPRTTLKGEKLVVINFDILKGWYPLLADMRPQMLIIDECQNIQNQTTIKSKFVTKLGRTCPYILALSGTPITNRPSDFYPTLHLVRPDIFPIWATYAHSYCGPTKGQWGWEFKGATNTDLLHNVVSENLMIRRLKKDVLPELPKKMRQVLPVEVPGFDEYYRAEDDFLKWLREKSVSRARRAAKAEAATKMAYLKGLAARKKVPLIKEWIDEFLADSDEKLVVFACHTGMLNMLTKTYPTSSTRIDGSTPAPQRQLAVERFQTDPTIRLFFGNIQAAGTGTTLTAASTTLFTELDFRPGLLLQAEDRTNRIGQKFPTRCIYMVARNTIEERIANMLQAKQNVLQAILNGETPAEEFNLADMLFDSYGASYVRKTAV